MHMGVYINTLRIKVMLYFKVLRKKSCFFEDESFDQLLVHESWAISAMG